MSTFHLQMSTVNTVLVQQTKLRLLLSARDTGSAGHALAVLDEAAQHPWIELVVYADGPALDLLTAKYQFVKRFSLPAAQSPSSYYSACLISEARRIIESENPDAVLVGVSHCDEAGLDEAFLAAAFDRPRFAIQDFWGDVNLTLGIAAETYFALDEVAVRLTASRHGQSAIAIGSAKHQRYAALDVGALRIAARSKLGVLLGHTVVGYFGQSLAHLSGYDNLLRSLAKTLRKIGGEVSIIYRPHPREDEAEIAQTLACFSAAGIQATLVVDDVTECWLAASDVIVSCFSSCAYDAAFLNRFSPTPVNSSIYLLFNESVAEYFRSVTDLEAPPPTALGLATAVFDEKFLESTLCEAMSLQQKEETWRRAMLHLPDPANSARRILDEINRHVFEVTAKEIKLGTKHHGS